MEVYLEDVGRVFREADGWLFCFALFLLFHAVPHRTARCRARQALLSAGVPLDDGCVGPGDASKERSETPVYGRLVLFKVNAAGDFAMTPYPRETVSPGPLYFAHLTADGSYSSDILMWNSQPGAVGARISFFQ
jgi:hypothetical protein